MSISYDALIKKMEQELQAAKSASPQKMKNHLHTVKALAEVILDEKTSTQAKVVTQPVTPIVHQAPQQPMTIQAEKPLDTEDGANGDSLFDF